MTVNAPRPVNLDLTTLKYPPMAIASILHRISGIVLFLLLPFILFYASRSLESQTSFDAMCHQLDSVYNKAVLWAFTTALMYHVLAGFRHVIMDIGFGEQLVAARRSAVAVIAVALVLTVCLGVWIW